MSPALQKGEKDLFADRSGLSVSAQPDKKRRSRFFFSLSEWSLLGILSLLAFLPRLILALTLDVSTDEPIYVVAGNWYILLLRHLDITSRHWQYNNEHPAFAKILMGVSVYLSQFFHASNQLIPARFPSVLFGTLLVVSIYLFGRSPFGRGIALLAALSFACSPWVSFFSAQALLDTTMTALITLAYLLLWPAIQHPRLYLLCGILVGCAAASKYPAVLMIPGMIAFIAYYYVFLRPLLPVEQRPTVPWRWWMLGLALIPLSFFLADPPIWADPISRLFASLQFSLAHADTGHVTFWANQVYDHVPPWMILFVLAVKVSAFVTLPALFFLLLAIVRLCRFHWQTFLEKRTSIKPLLLPRIQVNKIESTDLLMIWLTSALLFFSRLTILVGTHYYLPVAPPLFLAGACGFVTIARFFARLLWKSKDAILQRQDSRNFTPRPRKGSLNWQAGLLFTVLAILLVGPHFLGLITINDADGYTSEFFNGENTNVAVMYSGYSDANAWLMAHSRTGGNVGIVGSASTVLWYISNPRQKGAFHFIVTSYGRKSYQFDYLVWPMSLVQRHWRPPNPWWNHIVHTITGGSTIYCYIMARDPSTLLP